jgi:hypothetical protein
LALSTDYPAWACELGAVEASFELLVHVVERSDGHVCFRFAMPPVHGLLKHMARRRDDPH